MDAHGLAEVILGAVESSPAPVKRIKGRFIFSSPEKGKLSVSLKVKKMKTKEPKRSKIDIVEWMAMRDFYQ
jgi:hypothetical protein